MKPERLDDAMKRTRGYWYDDGLVDIAVGAVLLLIGLLFYAQVLLPPDFAGGNLTSIGLPVVVIVGWFIGSKLVRIAKERITYPRTGYVEYQQPPRKVRPLAAIVGAAIAVLLSLLISTRPASLALVPALQGLSLGALILYIGYRAGVVRYYVLGLLSAVIGVAVALVGFDEVLGNAVYFATSGAALVVSGCVALALYLRRTAPPTEG